MTETIIPILTGVLTLSPAHSLPCAVQDRPREWVYLPHLFSLIKWTVEQNKKAVKGKILYNKYNLAIFFTFLLKAIFLLFSSTQKINSCTTQTCSSLYKKSKQIPLWSPTKAYQDLGSLKIRRRETESPVPQSLTFLTCGVNYSNGGTTMSP